MANKNRLIDEHARRLRTLETLGTDILTPALSALYMPQLRGFWPCSAMTTANVFDISGQSQTLTINGGMVFGFDSLSVYAIFDGVDDFLSIADSFIYDPTGSFTLFGWFYNTNLSANHTYFGKWDTAGNQCQYSLQVDTNGVVSFDISGDGIDANKQTVSSSVDVAAAQWHFAAGRFTTGSLIEVVVNDTITSAATATATVFNGTADFRIGVKELNILSGRGSLFGYCAAALNDTQLAALYRNGRALFGV